MSPRTRLLCIHTVYLPAKHMIQSVTAVSTCSFHHSTVRYRDRQMDGWRGRSQRSAERESLTGRAKPQWNLCGCCYLTDFRHSTKTHRRHKNKRQNILDHTQSTRRVWKLICWQTLCQLSLMPAIWDNCSFVRRVQMCVFPQPTVMLAALLPLRRVSSGQLVLRYTLCPVAQATDQISNIWDGDEGMRFPQLPWQPLERESSRAGTSRVMDWKALSSESLFDPRWSAESLKGLKMNKECVCVSVC